MKRTHVISGQTQREMLTRRLNRLRFLFTLVEKESNQENLKQNIETNPNRRDYTKCFSGPGNKIRTQNDADGNAKRIQLVICKITSDPAMGQHDGQSVFTGMLVIKRNKQNAIGRIIVAGFLIRMSTT